MIGLVTSHDTDCKWAVYILVCCKIVSVNKLISGALILTFRRIEVVINCCIVQFQVDKTLRIYHKDAFEVSMLYSISLRYTYT